MYCQGLLFQPQAVLGCYRRVLSRFFCEVQPILKRKLSPSENKLTRK